MTDSLGDKGPTKRRFKNRHPQLIDIVDRFEAIPSSTHIRNARGAIERVREEGASFWKEGSSQLTRWRRYCNVLWDFIQTDLGNRRHLKNQDLATALREFIQEFEHSTGGMYKMLYGTSDDPESDSNITRMLDWFNLIYKFSTYAILAFWIDDKTEHVATTISLNLTTGESTQETTREEMKVPKKYQRATKDL